MGAGTGSVAWPTVKHRGRAVLAGRDIRRSRAGFGPAAGECGRLLPHDVSHERLPGGVHRHADRSRDPGDAGIPNGFAPVSDQFFIGNGHDSWLPDPVEQRSQAIVEPLPTHGVEVGERLFGAGLHRDPRNRSRLSAAIDAETKP
jgi:hypothetical protein